MSGLGLQWHRVDRHVATDDFLHGKDAGRRLRRIMITPRRKLTRGARGMVLLVCLGLCMSAAALAQGQPPPDAGSAPAPRVGNPPLRALFGSSETDPELTRGVDITGSVFEVYDQNLLAEAGMQAPSRLLERRGAYTNLLGDVRYERRGSRLQLGGTGGASARYYPGISEFLATDYHAGFGVSARTTPLTTVAVNQAFSYSPIFLLGLFVTGQEPRLGDPRQSVTDFAVTDDRSVTTSTSADVERRLSDRSLAIASGSYRRSHYLVENPNGTDFTTLDGGGVYRYLLSNDHDLELGYTYRRARYSGEGLFGPRPEPNEHIVNAGFSYHPTLTESRPTVVTFDVGTAIVHAPVPTDVFRLTRQVRVVGEATVLHQVGRTWLLEGAFKRGTAFVEGLGAPVFVDAVTATANGFLNRRTDMLLSLSYSSGEPSLVGAITTFSTTSVNARVRFALSSRWAVTSEYLFYHYDFSKIPDLLPGLNPRVQRNSVRAGVSLWLPAFRP
ncbi:MAG: hypothetical protein HOP16_06115 [Acidobacteria bacterium]|nr:hypothetical protein [Acidobacteriota bacterium]